MLGEADQATFRRFFRVRFRLHQQMRLAASVSVTVPSAKSRLRNGQGRRHATCPIISLHSVERVYWTRWKGYINEEKIELYNLI
jgi:hypothetical protein